MDSSLVGQPYISGRTEWAEGAGHCYAADGHVLSIFMRSPDRRKVEAVRRSRCQYALVSGPGIFFLMYRFARAIGWSGAPYWGALLPNEERSVPAEGWPEGGAFLQVVLVNAATGLIRAQRATTLPPYFACELHEAIQRQAMLPPLGKSAYYAALAKVRRICPTARRLLQRAVTWTGPVPPEKLAHRIWLREHQLNQLTDLLGRFSNLSDDKEMHMEAAKVMRALDAELERQRFMRLGGTSGIPHD